MLATASSSACRAQAFVLAVSSLQSSGAREKGSNRRKHAKIEKKKSAEGHGLCKASLSLCEALFQILPHCSQCGRAELSDTAINGRFPRWPVNQGLLDQTDIHFGQPLLRLGKPGLCPQAQAAGDNRCGTSAALLLLQSLREALHQAGPRLDLPNHKNVCQLSTAAF